MHSLVWDWIENPEIFEFLRDRVLPKSGKRDRNSQLHPQKIAIEAIAQLYPSHPDTLPLLRNRSENDADFEVREFAKQTWDSFEESTRDSTISQ